MATFVIYNKYVFPDPFNLSERTEGALRGCDGARHVEQLVSIDFEIAPDGVRESYTVEGHDELGPCDGSCGHLGSFTWPPEAPRESPA